MMPKSEFSKQRDSLGETAVDINLLDLYRYKNSFVIVFNSVCGLKWKNIDDNDENLNCLVKCRHRLAMTVAALFSKVGLDKCKLKLIRYLYSSVSTV